MGGAQDGGGHAEMQERQEGGECSRALLSEKEGAVLCRRDDLDFQYALCFSTLSAPVGQAFESSQPRASWAAMPKEKGELVNLTWELPCPLGTA